MEWFESHVIEGAPRRRGSLHHGSLNPGIPLLLNPCPPPPSTSPFIHTYWPSPILIRNHRPSALHFQLHHPQHLEEQFGLFSRSIGRSAIRSVAQSLSRTSAELYPAIPSSCLRIDPTHPIPQLPVLIPVPLSNITEHSHPTLDQNRTNKRRKERTLYCTGP